MKKILFFLIFIMSSNSFAITGKQEFVIKYPDETLHFINDTEFMYVLQVKKNPHDRTERTVDVKCGIAPIKNGVSVMGPNTVVFYKEHAVVNNRKRVFYTTKKTDLLFYRDICPKKPRN